MVNVIDEVWYPERWINQHEDSFPLGRAVRGDVAFITAQPAGIPSDSAVIHNGSFTMGSSSRSQQSIQAGHRLCPGGHQHQHSSQNMVSYI